MYNPATPYHTQLPRQRHTGATCERPTTATTTTTLAQRISRHRGIEVFSRVLGI